MTAINQVHKFSVSEKSALVNILKYIQKRLSDTEAIIAIVQLAECEPKVNDVLQDIAVMLDEISV